MTRIRSWGLALAFAVTGASGPSPLIVAAEPAKEFIQALRARGYYDVAIDYLDSIAASGRGPQDLLETVELEKAITLLASSRQEADAEARERQLDAAQALLRQFLSSSASHPQANSARSQLGNLIAARARLRIEAARRGRGGKEKLAEARKLYDEARQVFAEHQTRIRSELEGIPKVLGRSKAESELAERRTQLRADFLQTELVMTAILEETADSVPDDEQARTKLLTKAAEKYDEIYKRYRTRLAGLYARLYQGRVNQTLGKYRDALGFYVELLDQPDAPEQFRVLKTKTLRLAVDCWLHESENKYLEVIRRCGAWVAKAEPHEDRDPDWLYLRLTLARAHLRQAAAATTNRRNSRVAVASRNEAEKQAKIVARYESPFRTEAREMIAELGGAVTIDRGAVVRNFTQARVEAKKKLDSLRPAQAKASQLRRQRMAAKDEASRLELDQELLAANQAASVIQQEAFDGFRLALRFADRETPVREVNLVRYMLAYLYYSRDEFYDAALLGDFVAFHFPDGSAARKCAELSLASYLQLYNRSTSDNRAFEIAQIISSGQRILQKWSSYPEGEQAAATLIPFLINSRELDRAEQFLSYIPTQSPRRSLAALKTGTALWRSYLNGISGRETQAVKDGELSAAELAELMERAIEILEEGVATIPDDMPIDETSAAAVLCLAQARVANGQSIAAIELLQDPHHGSLTLVRKSDPVSAVAGFRQDVYRTALRASIGSLTSPAAGPQIIDQTKQLMAEMAAAFGADPVGQKQLVTVYMGLAKELEQQLLIADPTVKSAISSAFDGFLMQLSESASDLSVLNWVAETFSSLGAGFDTQPELTQAAGQYYAQAARTFGNLLERVDLEPALRAQIQFRLAVVRKKQRKYEQATDIFLKLLAETNRALNLQVAAAETLQQWADAGPAELRGSLYEKAMQGEGRGPDGKPIVWGWGRIATLTAGRPQFTDSFHEARINLSRCRLGLARTKLGPDQARLFKMAEKDITLTERLYGLGGEPQRAKYDEVMKEIQRSRGENPIGLRAFAAPPDVGE